MKTKTTEKRRTLIDCLRDGGLEEAKKEHFRHASRGYQVKGWEFIRTKEGYQINVAIEYIDEGNPRTIRPLQELEGDYTAPLKKIRPGNFNTW